VATLYIFDPEVKAVSAKIVRDATMKDAGPIAL
jgi:hypothetical protein